MALNQFVASSVTRIRRIKSEKNEESRPFNQLIVNGRPPPLS
jgi:hypothetical protein